MMKRHIFLSFALVTALMSWADVVDPADFRIVCKDGSVAYFRGLASEMTFSKDASILYVTMDSNCTSFAIEGIEAIEFAEGGTYRDKYSCEASHIDVVIDPADDTEYTEVPEEVIADDTHDDYGDFIENYIQPKRVSIVYDGDKVTVDGKKVETVVMVGTATIIANGAHVTVLAPAKYAFSLKGTTSNGSFKLMADSRKTQITLDGVSITNPTGAAINIQSGKTMLIQVADGTTNYLEDGASYVLEDEEQQKGTFFSEGQLIFSGEGSLNVKSNYGHGIASDDYVRIRSGNITVNSTRDGISTKERFIMYGGKLTVDAKQDGVDAGEGYVEIGGGKLDIKAVDEGITASYEGEDDGTIDTTIDPYMEIKGGLIKVTTTGDKGHGIRAMSTLTMSGGIVQVTVKGAGSKAMLSEGDMSLTGGKVTALAEGDALYEADVQELSSAAAIRSKGTLKIENMQVGAKSTGTGGKGINNVGDITVKNSLVTVVALGTVHTHGNLDSHARGVTTDGDFTLDGGSLLVKSLDAPLYVSGTLAFANAAVYGGYQVGK